MQKIVTADYIIPEGISLSAEGKDLIRRIFVVNPGLRINLDQIKTHPWFTKNLPLELQVTDYPLPRTHCLLNLSRCNHSRTSHEG